MNSPSVLFNTRDGLAVHGLTVAARDALHEWNTRRSDALATGIWPVLLPNELSFPGFDEMSQIVEEGSATSAPPAAEILRIAESLDVQDLFQRFWQDIQPIDEDADEPFAWESFDESMTDLTPAIPARLVGTSGEVVLALVPAGHGEEVLAVLGWGDWNACPPAHEHVAILRAWRETYGAELRAIAHDTLELVVHNPPLRFEDALPLARDQYAYASDIIDQSEHSTVGSLASALVGSDHWHFWWD